MDDPWSEVNDPTTPAARLAEIVAAYPEFGPAILRHPHCYPALREWIEQFASAPVAAPPTPAEPVAVGMQPAPSSSGNALSASRLRGQPFEQALHLIRRRRVLVPVAIVSVIAIALGGGYWALVGSKLGGASSPEAAADKLVSSIRDFDPVALYGSLAPSEVDEFTQSVKKLADAHPKKGGVDSSKELSALRSALSITTTGTAYRTDKLAEGVERVMWTKGSIELSGSGEKVAEVESDVIEPYLASSLERVGSSPTEIARQKSELHQSLLSGIHLPTTLKASNSSLGIIAVQEGNGWYVSPILTYIDLTYRAYASLSAVAPDTLNVVKPQSFLDSGFAEKTDSENLGSTVVPAEKFDTPNAAAEALVTAAARVDSQSLAATMPLPERRLLSIYGPWIEKLMRPSTSNTPTFGNLSVTAAKFGSTVSGDRARVNIDSLDVSQTRHDSNVGEDVTNHVHLQGTCAQLTGEKVQDASYQDYFGNWVDDYQVVPNNWNGCFSDSRVLSRLGFSDFSLIAVKEDGGWLISPFATMGDAASIVSDRMLSYYESNRLSDLFAP